MKLIKNIDYYINEQKQWVFTAFYLKKRGYCCQNKCLHCPYGFSKNNKNTPFFLITTPNNMELNHTTTTLHLLPTAANAIHQDAQNCFPNECCGFFYGTETTDNKRHISVAIPVINSKTGDQRRRFEISAIDYMKAEKYAIENNLTLLGVYHSHPQHPAIPSEHDLKQAMPYFSYIIVSVMDGNVNHTRSWQLNPALQEPNPPQFIEEKIIFVQ